MASFKLGSHCCDWNKTLGAAFQWWLDLHAIPGRIEAALELSKKEHQDIEYVKESYGYIFSVDAEECLALKKIAERAGVRLESLS